MDDDALLDAALDGSLDLTKFKHRQHVQAAFAALRRFGFAGALAQLPPALARLAAGAGRPERYHETLTVAFMALINERLQAGGQKSFDAFAQANPDLMRPDALAPYYPAVVMDSDLARRVFVLPRPATVAG